MFILFNLYTPGATLVPLGVQVFTPIFLRLYLLERMFRSRTSAHHYTLAGLWHSLFIPMVEVLPSPGAIMLYGVGDRSSPGHPVGIPSHAEAA